MPNISYIKEGEGEIILLLHGWGQSKEMMLPLINDLKKKFMCVVVDLPGFGDTPFDNSFDLEEYVYNIRKFLIDNNITPKYIIGHSFGGKVATHYCLKYQDVDKLVIIASPLLKPRRGLKYYYKIYKYKLKKKLKIEEKNAGSSDYKNCAKDMKEFFVKVVNTHYNKELKKVDIPVLLIWGKEDKQVPLNKAKQLSKKIKDNKLVVLEGDHFAYLENIELTKLYICNFLRRGMCD